MNRNQFIVLLSGFCGSAFLGSLFAPRVLGVQAANAQVPQPVVENQQVVPNAGLRFIDEQGHVLAIIGRQGTGGALTLMAADGQPSVIIQGGVGGRIALTAMDGGGELRFLGQQGGGSMIFSSTSRGRTMSVLGTNGAKLFDLNCAQKDSTMMLAEAGGKKGLDFRAGQFGGEFTCLNNLQSPVGVMQSTDDGGTLTLTAPKKDGVFSALGSGSVNYREKGKMVWHFPPSE